MGTTIKEEMAEIKVKAGKLIVFSEGEYSSFGYCGHFVALRDITSQGMQACAARAAGNRNGGFGPADAARNGVIAEMIRDGLLLEVDCEEINLGSGFYLSEEFGVYASEWDND